MSSAQNNPQLDSNDYGVHDRWFILSLLFVNYFTLYTHRYVINYVQPPIRDEFGLSDLQLNALAWGFQFTYAFVQLFVGYLGDRFCRRSVLILSLTLSTAALAGMGLARGFSEMLALRILLAATQAASIPAIAGIMADCFTQRNRSRAVSVYLLSAPFSVVMAAWIGGAVADRAGWRMTMFLFGGLGFAVVAVLFFLLREPERRERQTTGLGQTGGSLRKTLLAVLSVRSFLLLALAYVLASNVVQQLDFFLPRHFSEHYHMKLEEAGLMATVAPQIGTVIGLFTGGFLADWLARRYLAGRFYVQIAGLLIAIPALFTIATTDSKTVILVALLIHGIGFWLYLSNLWTTTFEVIDPAARSTAIGLLNVTAGLLGSWSYLAVGKLRDVGVITDLRMVFTIFGFVLCLAVAVLVLLVCTTLRRDFRATSSDSEG